MAKGKGSRRRAHRRRSSKMIIMGGDGAADHAITTYGGIGQQQAISPTNNVIAVNTGAPAIVKGGAVALTPAIITGGGELTPANVNGGGIITDVAVPAALIYARNALSGRRLSGFSVRRSRRNRRRGSRRRRR